MWAFHVCLKEISFNRIQWGVYFGCICFDVFFVFFRLIRLYQLTLRDMYTADWVFSKENLPMWSEVFYLKPCFQKRSSKRQLVKAPFFTGPYVKLMFVETLIRWMRSWVKKKPQRWRSLLAIWVVSIRREKCCRLDHPYGSWETFTAQQTRRMYTVDSFELFLGGFESGIPRQQNMKCLAMVLVSQRKGFKVHVKFLWRCRDKSQKRKSKQINIVLERKQKNVTIQTKKKYAPEN